MSRDVDNGQVQGGGVSDSERYRLVVENLKDYAVFTMDQTGRIDSWNIGAEHLLGYREEEALGESGAMIFTPEDRALGVPEREIATAREMGRAEDNRWHLRRDGSRFFANGVLIALSREGPDGKAIVGFAKIMHDETRRLEQDEALRRAKNELEQRVAERTEALRRSEARFSKAFHASPAPTVIIRLADERFLDVNASFLSATGYERDEVVGRTLAEVGLYDDAPGRDYAADLLHRGSPVPLHETEVRTKAGGRLSVMAANELIELEGEMCRLDIFIDISARKRSEEELMEAIQEVMSDTAWFSRQVMEKLAQLRSGSVALSGTEALTPREQQVLGRIAKGLSNSAISQELGLAPQTVRNYVASIYQKLGVRSRAEAVVWARERGLG
ncbi:helix-turn-helix transcriptional regulator [Truepera radiovictrix]|uniref:Transcriptional regulator, LuxR family n=1 Tax=Truepera radiovictrix (strain DSM 17093 / CIP 108686 / LMG 22925 / RQ-24) TaxID=649638 RepID=D7CTK8_TRURR|nr:PAS domain S-box protein [Truepera radiovictrix]ADI13865.1 transcriptional regulator, LuxR family [Truepera radiovictrix DSM 17093]WMT57571.1 PAS domain S-box protein [Truepera radiovictrix]